MVVGRLRRLGSLRLGRSAMLYIGFAVLGLARGLWTHNTSLAAAPLVVLAGVGAFVLFDVLTPIADGTPDGGLTPCPR
jgi:hypothetical protein